jgi:hypothetical protein
MGVAADLTPNDLLHNNANTDEARVEEGVQPSGKSHVPTPSDVATGIANAGANTSQQTQPCDYLEFYTRCGGSDKLKPNYEKECLNNLTDLDKCGKCGAPHHKNCFQLANAWDDSKYCLLGGSLCMACYDKLCDAEEATFEVPTDKRHHLHERRNEHVPKEQAQAREALGPPPGHLNIRSYCQLMRVMEVGCKHGMVNAGNMLSKLAPQAHAVLQEHGIPLTAKEWHGRPPGFSVLLTNDNPCATFGPVTPDDFARRKPHMEADGEQARGEETAGEWDFSESNNHKHQQAKEAYAALVELLHGFKGVGGASKSNAGALLVSTSAGGMVSLSKALAVWQWKEWVSRDRGPRFWVYNLPEHKKMPPGHNCMLGTLLVLRWAPASLLLVKVHRMDRIRGEEHVRTCKIVPGVANQLLTVEVCWRVLPPPGSNKDDTYFQASGVFLPSLDARKITLVSPQMHEPTMMSCACAMKDVSVNECTMKNDNFLTAGAFTSLRQDDVQLLEANEAGIVHVDADVVSCCRCQKGWWDACTGPVQQCTGTCERWFHSDCAGVEFIDEWQCLKCTGVDNAVCMSCDHEWFSDDKLRHDATVNPYYTGAMLQCDGDKCGLWYHQQCHKPRIDDSFVAPPTSVNGKRRKKGNFLGKKWYCAACAPMQVSTKCRPKTIPDIVQTIPDPVVEQVVAHWICTYCNHINAAKVNTCGDKSCTKSRSHFGCDLIEPNEGVQRRSFRKTTPVDHPETLPWDGIRVADNATNVQRMHSSLNQPTLSRLPKLQSLVVAIEPLPSCHEYLPNTPRD